MEMLVNLRGVPEDEAGEIRELLDSQGIDYYETTAGNWGVGQPGIWVRDPQQAAMANKLLADYWQNRRWRIREQQARLDAEGRQRKPLEMLVRAPLRFIAVIGVIAAVVYFSIKPFLDFLR